METSATMTVATAPVPQYVIRTEKLTDDPVMERDVALLKLLPQRFRSHELPATEEHTEEHTKKGCLCRVLMVSPIRIDPLPGVIIGY